MQMPPDHVAAIGVIEVAALHRAKIARILEWPDLSSGQRMLAFTIACIELHTGAIPVPFDVAKAVGMPLDKIRDAFTNLKDSPYVLTDTAGEGLRFYPHQALEYGAR